MPESRNFIEGKHRNPLPPGILIALSLATMAGPISIDTYLPAFPVMAEALGATDAQIQFTLTAFMIGMAAGQFFIGPISDAVGRRKLLIASQGIAAVAAVICALAPVVELLMAGRLVQGLAGGAGVVLARAVVADMAVGNSAAKALSLMMTINGVAPILAPVIGAALLEPFGWRSIFWFIAAFDIIAMIVLAIAIRESLPEERRSAGGLRGLIGGIAYVVRVPGYLGYVMVFWFGFGAMFTYISGSPFVIQNQLGLTAGQFSMTFAAASVMIVVGNLLNVKLVDRFDPRTILAASLGIVIVASVLILIDSMTHPTLAIILALIMLFMLGMGMLMGNAAALATGIARERAGAASALLGAGQFIVAAIVSPMVGLGSDPARTMGAVMVVSAAIAVGGYVWARVSERPRPSAAQALDN